MLHRASGVTADAATGTPDSDYGYSGNCDVIRAEAWSFNNLAHAWFMSPDGSTEKTYFTEKMDRYAATLEGRLDLRTGNYFTAPNPGSATDPCNTSTYTVYKSTPWCFGHNTGFGNRANPLGMLTG